MCPPCHATPAGPAAPDTPAAGPAERSRLRLRRSAWKRHDRRDEHDMLVFAGTPKAAFEDPADFEDWYEYHVLNLWGDNPSPRPKPKEDPMRENQFDRVARHIEGRKRPVRIPEVAESLNLGRSTVTQHVRKLVMLKRVVSEPDPEDGRCNVYRPAQSTDFIPAEAGEAPAEEPPPPAPGRESPAPEDLVAAAGDWRAAVACLAAWERKSPDAFVRELLEVYRKARK